jgi:hypothetical protein
MNQPDRHYTINQWPSTSTTNEGVIRSRVPTEIAYSKLGYDWGYQIQRGADRRLVFEA